MVGGLIWRRGRRWSRTRVQWSTVLHELNVLVVIIEALQRGLTRPRVIAFVRHELERKVLGRVVQQAPR